MSDENNNQVIFAASAFLAPDEQSIIFNLLNSKQSPIELIPDGISQGDLWLHLSATTKAMRRIREATSKLKPLLGRMFLVLQKHPTLYTQQGYSNYNDFMSKGAWELFGISRAEAYNAVRLSEELGAISSETMAQIGISKLNLVASALRAEAAEGTPQEKIDERRAFWLEKAANDTVDELRQRMVDKDLANEGDLELANIVIPATKAQHDRWKDFVHNDLIRAYCETQSAGSILEKAIQEAEGTWLAQAHEAMKG